jgi:ribosomal protein S18 acetylase RimI-like enzyme
MAPTPTITIIEATPEHFDAIVDIERASQGSVVALAGVEALHHMAERGQWLVVATDADVVMGWIWFSMEIDRGGETTGTVFRIAVAEESRRSGVASALLEHARAVFVSREAVRIRVTMDAGDDAARAFFEAAGFSVGSMTMEQPL